MDRITELRELLARQLDWEDAHISYARAVAEFPIEARGVKPAGFAHSAWEFLEHLRLTQADILDFCVNADYLEPTTMSSYWPTSAEPSDEASWDASIAGFVRDVEALKRLALDESVDLFAAIPHGSGQTFIRELLLVVDHNAYSLGQFMALRRALGAWS